MQANKSSRRIVSVILAAGKGTRMNAPYLHKVCFPIEGRPVIARAIETYLRCGVQSQFVVVGPMAEQVMQAASIIPADLNFCYQPEQRGTGSAAKAAAKLLAAMDYDDDVLVVAGDKVIEDSILLKLIDTFHQTDSDLTFIVGDVHDFPSSGRVVCGEDSGILGIVEVFDIARMQLLTALKRITGERPVTPQEAESLAISYLKQERKAALALGPLWDAIKAGDSVTKEMMQSSFSDADFFLRINEHNVPPELLADVRHANISVYLFKAPALYSALDRLSSDNAQQEEYLTDTVGILSSEGRRVQFLPVDYPEQVMAFNTPEELKEIERHITSKARTTLIERPKTLRRAAEWLRSFEAAGPDSSRCLARIYGEAHPKVESKRRLLASALRSHIDHFGDETVLIARAPGRVNIMGRHVDHQGGHGNVIAIDRDLYLVVSSRSDRQVHIRSIEPHHFPDRSFDIDDLMADYRGGGWLDFVNSEAVTQRVAAAHGDWAQYVAAPIVRFQAKFPHRRLAGMNVVAAGDIPIAAGLSSSSAVVVATAEAVIHTNSIDVSPEHFVELCGEGEWYVGTRGGANDHAAMKFARKGRVTQVGFFPFTLVDTVAFPSDYEFVVFNSHQKARKTKEAKDVFNHRVSCYSIGRELLKNQFPKYASAVEHLRDFNLRNLGVSYPELLAMLKSLPVDLGRSEIASSLSSDQAARYLTTHSESLDSYPVRCVVIYGLAECERSRACANLLGAGDVEQFGRWMNISHDGDRVVRWDETGNSWPFTANYSDAGMEELITRAESADPEAELVLQPGAYGCSIPQIDQMVDIALSVDGVVGAQLSGAGLGGCIMVLVHKDAREEVEKAMVKHYYTPADLEPDFFACSPVGGSAPISF